MQLKKIPEMQSSMAITLLSMAECVTYVVASFMGDYLKDRLVYVNVYSAGALAVICIVWPMIDVAFEVILAISLGEGHRASTSLTLVVQLFQVLACFFAFLGCSLTG